MATPLVVSQYDNSFNVAKHYFTSIGVMEADSLDDLLDSIEIGKIRLHSGTIENRFKPGAVTKMCKELDLLAERVYHKHAFHPNKEDRQEDLQEFQAKCQELTEALSQ